MTWIYLLIAGLFEVVWAVTMKLSDSFSNLFYSLVTLGGLVLSFVFLALAMKHLPLSLAYPIWTGIGTVGAVVVGIFIFKESISPVTLIFVLLLVIGIIGIKMTSHS